MNRIAGWLSREVIGEGLFDAENRPALSYDVNGKKIIRTIACTTTARPRLARPRRLPYGGVPGHRMWKSLWFRREQHA
jgi:hypothetical protein